MRVRLLILLSFIAFANAATEYGHCLLYNGKCYTCDWSRCDCVNNYVLDDVTGRCVEMKDCSRLSKIRSKKTRRNKSTNKSEGKKIKIKAHDSDDLDYMARSSGSGFDSYKSIESVLIYPGSPMPEHNTRYTGHCPMLKFRFGKSYGDNTRQILKEIKSKGLFNKPLAYKPGANYELDNMPRHERPQRDVYDGINHRQPTYMTGYTGYVPGMHFRYGKSYGRAADDCMADFKENQRDLKRRADLNRSYVRSRSAPRMETVHTRDEIRRDLNKFREINKYKENTISPEFPPIAGYTGHIPHIKGSEASLSQRYRCAAKRGLELIKIQRDRRKEIQNADMNIKAILRNPEKKYSYWNWG